MIVVCPFVPFGLAIMLSVLLPFTVSDYHFSTFKLFFHGAIYTSIILLSTEATLDVMKYVGHNGIPVQECVQDVNGRFWTTETVADTHNDR